MLDRIKIHTNIRDLKHTDLTDMCRNSNNFTEERNIQTKMGNCFEIENIKFTKNKTLFFFDT
jgi:hypothetical protein